MIAVLEESMKFVEAGDFGRQHERFGLPVKPKITSRALAFVVGLPQPLDLDLADRLAYPSGGAWLTGLQEIFVAGCDSIASASSP